MIPHQALDFPAEPFSQANYFRLFCYCRDSDASELIKHVIAKVREEAFSPATSCGGHMAIWPFEHVQDNSGNYLAIAFDPNCRVWR